MNNLAASPWLFAVLGGFVLLGLAMAYGMMRNRGRTPAQRAVTEAATHAEYKREDD